MATEDLSIFEDEGKAPDAEAVEAPVEEPAQEEPAEEPAKAEPEAEPAAEAEPEGVEQATPPVAEPEKDAPHVPMMAMLDEREKRQNAERQLQEMQQRMQMMQQQQQPQKRPDFFENPEAAMEARVTDVKLQQSRFLAEQQYGKETVDQAYAYFGQNPQKSQALLKHPSPFHAAVEQFKQAQFLQEVGADPDQWREQERERIKAEIIAQMPAQQPAKPPVAPPASLSKAGASGQNTIPDVAVPKDMDRLFNG